MNRLSKELPPELVKCSTETCIKLNQRYAELAIDQKLFLIDLTRVLRKNIKASAEDVAGMLKMSRPTLFLKLQKAGLKFEEVRKALLDEAEEAVRKKIERRALKALPAMTKAEFMEREVVKRLVNQLRAGGKTKKYIESLINFFYRLCSYLGLAPEAIYELEKEKLYDMITAFLSEELEKGKDVNTTIARIQSLEKHLGTKILPPGLTQKEYKGKYQEAEIPLHVRDALVTELLNYYESTGNELYLNCIQAMAFLYYTGSRRQALMNYQKSDIITVNHPQLVRALGENRFRLVLTLEKRGLYWKKLIPMSYDIIIPPRPFSPEDVDRMAELLKNLLMKYRDQLNKHTQLYLEKSKVYHIWRHTATREYLRALGYNRYLVAKLLGWIKDSNLVIYGDYDLLQLLQLGGEEHKVQFVSPEVYRRLISVFGY